MIALPENCNNDGPQDSLPDEIVWGLPTEEMPRAPQWFECPARQAGRPCPCDFMYFCKEMLE